MFEIKTFENNSLNCAVSIINAAGCYWFRGKDIAASLGYSDTKQAVRVHVENEDRKKLNELRGCVKNVPNT